MATTTAEAQRTKSVAGDGIKRRKGTQLSQQGRKRVTSFAQKARSLHRLLEHRKDVSCLEYCTNELRTLIVNGAFLLVFL